MGGGNSDVPVGLQMHRPSGKRSSPKSVQNLQIAIPFDLFYGLSCVSACVCAQPLSHVQLLATPWTANPPSSSVHGISQARILDWVAISFFRGSSQPGIEPVSLTLAGRFFTIEPPGKPRDKIKQRCICKDVHCCDVYNSETKLDKTKTGKLSRCSKIFPSRIQGKWFLIKVPGEK